MKPNPHVRVGSVTFGNDLPIVLIAGPCQLESRAHAFDIAGRLKEISAKAGIGLVYKTSFDKANRTSLAGKRGLGLEAALPVFEALRTDLDVPILTDVHEREQCALVAPVVDILQIPAFLSRQTDLLVQRGEHVKLGCLGDGEGKGVLGRPYVLPGKRRLQRLAVEVAGDLRRDGNRPIVGRAFGQVRPRHRRSARLRPCTRRSNERW